MRREFDGRYDVGGIILVDKKWRRFSGSYSVDAETQGKISIGPEIEIIVRSEISTEKSAEKI